MVCNAILFFRLRKTIPTDVTVNKAFLMLLYEHYKDDAMGSNIR